MNKETEQWIEENNPYCKSHPCNECIKNIFHNQCQISPSECEKYKALINVKYGWQEGAKAMAEHLEQQQNELWEKWRADEIIEAGLKELKNQPPTKKQIIGVLKYVYYEIFPEYDITPQGFDILVEDILNKWDYDD